MTLNMFRIGLLPMALLTLAAGCDDDNNGGSGSSDTDAGNASSGQESGDADGDSQGQESGNGEGGSELEDVVDDAVALSEQASEVVAGTCDCWEAFGFGSQDTCESALEIEDTSFDRDCLLEALSMDPEAAIENFTCERPGLVELISCLTAALDSCDGAAFSACTEAPEPDCTDLPDEIDTAVEACLGA
ncbi:MAG: hypothetical protein KUG77_25950 [Nannocystaceae bacterium]|nr:hypothetical protein [Nannocystaceae bacterium]